MPRPIMSFNARLMLTCTITSILACPPGSSSAPWATRQIPVSAGPSTEMVLCDDPSQLSTVMFVASGSTITCLRSLGGWSWDVVNTGVTGMLLDAGKHVDGRTALLTKNQFDDIYFAREQPLGVWTNFGTGVSA